MNQFNDDGLWPLFAPFWKDLRAVAPRAVLAGGYGLFLKQRWLLSQQKALVDHNGDRLAIGDSTGVIAVAEPTLVEISRWSNRVPRATKDFDFIVGLDLIASEEDQIKVTEVLRRHHFDVVPHMRSATT